MLSYLHGFHAGGAADLLKHSALAFCLAYLKEKAKPLLCVDTHAGAGLYDLSGSVNRENREWEKGIGRLSGTEAKPPMLESYVRLSCAKVSTGAGETLRYKGSPAIMAGMLEKGDRLVCFELHPREFGALKASMEEVREGEGKALVEVRREDGLGGLRTLLPPPSRRGLVFIDPSWEERNEYEAVPDSVLEGLRRFPGGTFIIWYPLLAMAKEKAGVSPVGDTLYGLADLKRCRAELRVGAAEGRRENSPRGMYGSGLVIYNPPWTLRSALEEPLPYLAKILGDGEGSWRLDWDAR